MPKIRILRAGKQFEFVTTSDNRPTINAQHRRISNVIPRNAELNQQKKSVGIYGHLRSDFRNLKKAKEFVELQKEKDKTAAVMYSIPKLKLDETQDGESTEDFVSMDDTSNESTEDESVNHIIGDSTLTTLPGTVSPISIKTRDYKLDLSFILNQNDNAMIGISDEIGETTSTPKKKLKGIIKNPEKVVVGVIDEKDVLNDDHHSCVVNKPNDPMIDVDFLKSKFNIHDRKKEIKKKVQFDLTKTEIINKEYHGQDSNDSSNNNNNGNVVNDLFQNIEYSKSGKTIPKTSLKLNIEPQYTEVIKDFRENENIYKLIRPASLIPNISVKSEVKEEKEEELTGKSHSKARFRTVSGYQFLRRKRELVYNFRMKQLNQRLNDFGEFPKKHRIKVEKKSVKQRYGSYLNI